MKRRATLFDFAFKKSQLTGLCEKETEEDQCETEINQLCDTSSDFSDISDLLNLKDSDWSDFLKKTKKPVFSVPSGRVTSARN